MLTEEHELFDVLDLNKDMVLSGPEIVLWLSPDNVKPAMEEVDRWFSEIGVETSEELSFSAILKKADAFIESKALENGRIMRFADEL